METNQANCREQRECLTVEFNQTQFKMSIQDPSKPASLCFKNNAGTVESNTCFKKAKRGKSSVSVILRAIQSKKIETFRDCDAMSKTLAKNSQDPRKR